MQNSSHDVVIVGARPAGAATAMLLARQGLDVLVVDRAEYGRDTVSTHALMRAGVLQLHRWGLLDAIIDAGTPPVRRTSFHYEDGSLAMSLKPAAGVDALYAPRRTLLDRLLVDAARGAGASIRFGTTVKAVLRDGNGRVTGVSGRDNGGREFVARARLTIGADGLNSFVARQVVAPFERVGRNASACRVRVLARSRRGRLRVVLARGNDDRAHPDQRERGVRLHHRAARTGALPPRTAS